MEAILRGFGKEDMGELLDGFINFEPGLPGIFIHMRMCSL